LIAILGRYLSCEGIRVRNEEGKLAVKEVLPGLKGREKRSPAQPA